MTDHGNVITHGAKHKVNPHWRKDFLAKLAESSNVARSADLARISPARAFKARREEPDFAQAWLAALGEGYVHLELEVLRRLREGDQTTGSDAKYDFSNAIRLLNAHRENAAHFQARQRNVSAAEVRASIDRKVEDIRLKVKRDQLQSEKSHS